MGIRFCSSGLIYNQNCKLIVGCRIWLLLDNVSDVACFFPGCWSNHSSFSLNQTNLCTTQPIYRCSTAAAVLAGLDANMEIVEVASGEPVKLS